MQFSRFNRVFAACVVAGGASTASAVPVTSGMLYHLDAGEGVVLSGSNVTQWQDQSGNNRHFSQATAAKQPLYVASGINGLPVIRFDGNNTAGQGDELVLGSATTPLTVFIVNNVATGGGLRGVWGSENNDAGIRQNTATQYRGGNSANTDGNDFTAHTSIATHQINGVESVTYAVGTPHIIAGERGSNFNAGKYTFNNTSVGEYFTGRAFAGDVAEVIAYDRALTAREVHQVEGSLGLKYDLAVRPGFVIAGPIGGDLTDPENNGSDATPAGTNFNAIFRANQEAYFSQNPLVAPSNEAAFDVFDNKVGGGEAKWCCGNPAVPGGLWVEADFGASQYFLDSFTLTSSNDSPERDPLFFSILGSDDGVNFEEIFTYNNQFGNLFTARNQTLLFEAGVDYAVPTEAYSIFRYNVTGAGTTAHALGEIEFFGTLQIPEPATMSLGVIGLLLLGRRRSRLA